MKKYLAAVAGIATCFVLMLNLPAQAKSGVFKDGGYASSSNDSGTCGPDWAADTYSRRFITTLPADMSGNYHVVEKFLDGAFTTFAGTSPGACQAGPDNGNTVKGGVKGTFSGFYDLTVMGGTLNVNGTCDLVTDPGPQFGQCTTAGWVSGHFGPSATYTLNDWGFTYHSKSKKLTSNKWINAQAGNSGDISW